MRFAVDVFFPLVGRVMRSATHLTTIPFPLPPTPQLLLHHSEEMAQKPLSPSLREAVLDLMEALQIEPLDESLPDFSSSTCLFSSLPLSSIPPLSQAPLHATTRSAGPVAVVARRVVHYGD
jgi:hypothetical protein